MHSSLESVPVGKPLGWGTSPNSVAYTWEGKDDERVKHGEVHSVDVPDVWNDHGPFRDMEVAIFIIRHNAVWDACYPFIIGN